MVQHLTLDLLYLLYCSIGENELLMRQLNSDVIEIFALESSNPRVTRRTQQSVQFVPTTTAFGQTVNAFFV